MNCTEVKERLDDLVDDLVGGRERAFLDDHLSSCHGCRRELRELRELVAAAARLPRTLEPEGDPWPRIAAAIGGGTATAQPSRFTWPAWLLPPRLALAAVAVAALATALPIVLILRQSPAPAGRGALRPASFGAAPNDYRRAETEFRAATALLQEALERRKPTLRPETIKVVEENLLVINEAIEAVRVALDSDPGDRRLGEALTAMYHKMVDHLLKAAALPAEI
ncbi:MAG: zf-HC2 domain-containing protein [Acidobacteria bacterium]|nr:zf-HC2 domain-containing protein [Acidobacteriota bacterium]